MYIYMYIYMCVYKYIYMYLYYINVYSHISFDFANRMRSSEPQPETRGQSKDPKELAPEGPRPVRVSTKLPRSAQRRL